MRAKWWHAILPVWSLCILWPVLTAAQASQPSSCIRCHGELEEELARPVQNWRGSIHADNGIACHDCHGGDMTLEEMDEAMDEARGFVGAPDEEEVPDFCGKCHRGVADDYLASAHGRALGSGGPQCVTCHGSHAIERPAPSLINPETCSRCHGFERARIIRDALIQTDELIVDLERELQRLHRRGMAVEALNGKLFQARNTFHRLFHSVDVEKVRDRTSSIQTALGEIRQQMEAMDEKLGRRRAAGSVVVVLLSLVTLLLFYIRNTYRQEEEG